VGYHRPTVEGTTGTDSVVSTVAMTVCEWCQAGGISVFHESPDSTVSRHSESSIRLIVYDAVLRCMRPVIDDEVVERAEEATAGEFSVPEEHVRFTHRVDALCDMIDELQAKNQRLEQQVRTLKQRQQEQQQGDDPTFLSR